LQEDAVERSGDHALTTVFVAIDVITEDDGLDMRHDSLIHVSTLLPNPDDRVDCTASALLDQQSPEKDPTHFMLTTYSALFHEDFGHSGRVAGELLPAGVS